MDGGNNEPVPANTAQVPVTFNGNGELYEHATPVYHEQRVRHRAAAAPGGRDARPAHRSNPRRPSPSIRRTTGLPRWTRWPTDGNVTVAFTDDPESADEQQALLKKGHYGLIPVALTANVVGYKAYMQGTTGFLYPLTSLDLTPTEVAGLATYLYTGPSVADVAPCPAGALPQGWCTDPSPCLPPVAGVSSCEILGELNSQPGGFILPTTYGSYVRSDATGITDQLFSWLCQATNRTVTWNGQTATEPATGGATLLTGLNAGLPSSGKLTSCPATDTFPSLTDFGGTQADRRSASPTSSS